jgi:hypothetical protein
LKATPDWESDRAVAFDLFRSEGRRKERVFFPKKMIETRDGVAYVSDWIFGKKVEELSEKFNTDVDRIREVLAAHVLGDRGITVQRDAGLPTVRVGSLITFFDNPVQQGKVKFPKITFGEGDDLVRFQRAGDKAKVPGSINVTDGKPFGDNKWFGRIERDGTFKPSRACTQEVLDLVERFAASPEVAARKSAKATGNCVFCFKELEVERSRVAGYGPVCAKNYGLPY